MPFSQDASWPGFLYCFDSKYPRDAFRKHKEPRHTPIGLHTQTKPNPRYFRQYRNPGQDASWENGTYDHPMFADYSRMVLLINLNSITFCQHGQKMI